MKLLYCLCKNMLVLKTFFLLCLFIASSQILEAQTIRGIIFNQDKLPIRRALVRSATKITYSDSSGRFLMVVGKGQFQIIVSHPSYQNDTVKFTAEGDLDLGIIELRDRVLKETEILAKDESDRMQAGTLRLDGETIRLVPVPFGDFNQRLASIGMGLASNSELSGGYRVRGGNFDENLVYVNNIAVYRPFLVRAGQQEGLSFVNADMVGEVEFSSGGWQPKYGDKLSSVLAVEYKTPPRSAVAADVSLLGLNAFASGGKGRLRSMIGVRYKSARYLLGTLETKGEYLPNFTDVQSFTTLDISRKSDKSSVLEWLNVYARNRYFFRPSTRTTKFGTFGNVLQLTVAFEGTERMEYDVLQSAIKWKKRWNERFHSELIGSWMFTRELEWNNTLAAYLLSDIKTPNQPEFNRTLDSYGIGTHFDYARNRLKAQIGSLESRNTYRRRNREIQFGARLDLQQIDDLLNENGFLDSADYVLASQVYSRFAENSIGSVHWSGYLQLTGGDTVHHYTIGVRTNFWNFSGQTLFSPRAQYSYTPPNWKRETHFNLSAGLYGQHAFFREMRDFAGQINRNIRAQESAHLVASVDYPYRYKGKKFRLISELYYKYLWNVVPYDVDNVRLRYYAQNNAVAYAMGGDLRVSGEFIKGTESWLGLGLLSTREKVEEDPRGYVRRPSDQRLTFSMFFQDQMPSDPSFRFFIRFLYGSGFPFGPPNQPKLRNIFSAGNTYYRVDLGIAKLLYRRRSTGTEAFWMYFEVLNAAGANNNISFTWIRDFSGGYFGVPNSLSQRFFNLRITMRY